MLFRFEVFTLADVPLMEEWYRHPSSRYAAGIQNTLHLLPSYLSDSHFAWMVHADTGPVAMVEAQIEGAKAPISLFVDPARQGRGLGRQILAEVVARPELRRPGLGIVAYITVANTPSVRCFRAAGFTPVDGPPDEHGLLEFQLRE